jgi:lipoic acid synthetase
MLLGDECTRHCRFCAVRAGNPRGALDPGEPERVARAVSALRLDYVVLTMVTRDDLPDGGAGHVAATVRAVRALGPGLGIEALVGDFAGSADALDTVLAAAPDVLAHNLEVVRSATPALRDHRCDYDRSLALLRRASEAAPDRLTKSSLMVGVGERDDEVLATLADLRAAGVGLVAIGQYLQPTREHAPVARYVPPAEFAAYRRAGLALGFAHVASGPLVRSSYLAAEAFVRADAGG